jgi:pimeloyl-ACP methyl ester carboxylesterase
MPSRGPNGKGSITLSVPEHKDNLPPLVFLHGTFHGAWCWGENFFSHFAILGYPLAAFDCRGSGEHDEIATEITIQEHGDGLQCLLDQLPDIMGCDAPLPILMGHSFGGMIAMKYLEGLKQKPSEAFSGIITMCSLPPTGYVDLYKRYTPDKWIALIRFSQLVFVTDQALCRKLFFGEEKPSNADSNSTGIVLSYEDIARYQEYFARDCKVSTDTKNLPWPSMKVDEKREAPFVNDLPPCLVVGAEDDFIADLEACIETADYFGLSASGPCMVDGAHDVMIVPQWKLTAEKIQMWIEESVSVSHEKRKP